MRHPISQNGTQAEIDKSWYIASEFGKKRTNYYHSGVDWNLKTGGDTDLGQPLYAICAGEISGTDTTSTTGFGKQIFLKFNDPLNKQKTFYAMYAHCNSVTVKVGQKVKEGDKLGTIGKSGTKFAHLHFSIKNKANGMDNVPNTLKELKEWENPTQFIKDRIDKLIELDPTKDISSEWESELGLKDYEVYDLDLKRMNVKEIVAYTDNLYHKYKGLIEEMETTTDEYSNKLDDLREANGLELEKLNKGLHSISEALSEVDGDSSLEKVNYLLERISEYENIVENEEVNTVAKDTFPGWKKAIIEGRRVFVLALLAELAVVISNAPLLAEVNNWSSILALLVIPVITGAAKAVLKWAQEKYGQGDYSKLIYKI